MAKTTFSGPSAVRNLYSSAAEPFSVGDPCPLHPGLVGHALLTPSLQVQILSVVDASGSATVGDLIAELPGHPDPVGAVFALINAGVLSVPSTGIVDANTDVARASDTGANGEVHAHSEPAGSGPSDRASNNTPFGADHLPANVTDHLLSPLPVRLVAVPTCRLLPKIIIGPGESRCDFGRVDCLKRPGVYFLLRDREVYVGYGADVGFRITDGRQMPGGIPDCIIAIADEMDGLSADDAKSLERILWSWVAADADFDVTNGVPDGWPITPQRYGQLSLFAGQTAVTLRQAGLMFLRGSAREHIAGPQFEPGRLGEPRATHDIPDGPVMELNHRGLTALATERSDGSWLLLRGSDVRIDTVASATANATFQRAALLHAGLLERSEGCSSYVLRQDLVFPSARSAGYFASGSKSTGRSAWKPIDEGDAGAFELAL